MKVRVNNEDLSIDWRYENPELQMILDENGLSINDYREKGGKEIMRLINGKLGNGKVNSLPAPSICFCTIRREDKSIVAESQVIRHKNDRHVYTKARSYSLAKTLSNFLPGRENRETRTEIWNTYLNKKLVTA